LGRLEKLKAVDPEAFNVNKKAPIILNDDAKTG
jgi:flagellar assembly factor FliW